MRFCSALSEFESIFLSKKQILPMFSVFHSQEYWLWGCIYILFSHVSSSIPCRCLRYQSILPFFFLFVSRYLYADPLHCNMTYLLIRLLKDDLKEYTYAARLSGLVYAISSGMNAILVSKMEKETGSNEMAWELSAVWKNVGILISKQSSY